MQWGGEEAECESPALQLHVEDGSGAAGHVGIGESDGGFPFCVKEEGMEDGLFSFPLLPSPWLSPFPPSSPLPSQPQPAEGAEGSSLLPSLAWTQHEDYAATAFFSPAFHPSPVVGGFSAQQWPWSGPTALEQWTSASGGVSRGSGVEEVAIGMQSGEDGEVVV